MHTSSPILELSIDANSAKIASSKENNHSSYLKIQEYCFKRGGKRVIQRVLIANNGIAALKEIRSVRKWSYDIFQDDRIIQFVVMATPDDINANAEYIRLADEYILVPGGPNNLNYANVPLIVDIALKSKVQAVWAGWGHASENPKLPEMLAQNGLIFIGPTAGAMRSLGDKIASMIVAQTARVPCLPWSGSGLTMSTKIDLNGNPIFEEHKELQDDLRIITTIPEEIFQAACVSTPEIGLEMAKSIGFPLMIKASEGGGGKGIRAVTDQSSFLTSLDAAQREVPGSPVFLMALSRRARHLEVQLLADEYGQAIALNGRDCSMQRRHQKVIEEAPITCLSDPTKWKEMEKCAVRLAKMVSYTNAGTVEYLWDVEEEIFSFLELNPRLQVEHPCSEMITGVNIPVAQLLIAMGIPLNRISDVRALYGELDVEDGSSEIDFDERSQLPPRHHVIACRITAENPEDGWKPGGGRLEELTFRSSERVWGYFSIPGNGGMVHPYSDSQIGHIFSRGPTREEARKSMVVALKETSIRAEFMTSTEYLVKLLEMDAFKENKHNTEFLDTIIRLSSPPITSKVVKEVSPIVDVDLLNQSSNTASTTAMPPKTEKSNGLPMHFILCAGVCWRAMALFNQWSLDNIGHLKRGQKPLSLERRLWVTFQYSGFIHNIEVRKGSEKSFILSYKTGSSIVMDSLRLSDGGLLIQMESGETLVTYALGDPGHPKDGSEGGLSLKINGSSYHLDAGHQDPTELRSPSPGKLSRWIIPDSSIPLPKGTPVAEIEVMKMYMQLVLPHKATVTILKAEGENVEAGELLARLLPTDLDLLPSLKEWTTSFSTLPCIATTTTTTRTLDDRWLELNNVVIRGFYPSQAITKENIFNIFFSFLDPSYGLGKLKLLLTNVRLPSQLDEKVSSLMLEDNGNGNLSQIHSILLNYSKTSCDSRDLAAMTEILSQLEPLLNESWIEGLLLLLLDGWLEVALQFEDVPSSSLVLQRMHIEQMSPEEQLSIFSSYNESLRRSNLLSLVIEVVIPLFLSAKSIPLSGVSRTLEQISRLQQKETGNVLVAAKAREALMRIMGPGIVEMRDCIECSLRGNASSTQELDSISKGLLPWATELLPSFLLHPEASIRVKAMEQYIRRVFEAFLFVDVELSSSSLLWTLEAPTTSIFDGSNSNFNSNSSTTSSSERRSGIFVSFLENVQMSFVVEEMIRVYLPSLKIRNSDDKLKNIAYIALSSCFNLNEFLLALKVNASLLGNVFGLRRITVIVPGGPTTIFHTFRFNDSCCSSSTSSLVDVENNNNNNNNKSNNCNFLDKRWYEDLSVRQMEPALAYLLELKRIHPCYPGGLESIFNDPTGQIHIYRSPSSARLWVRVLVRPRLGRRGKNRMSDLVKDGQEIFMETLDCLQYIINKKEGSSSLVSSCNHLMINIIPPFHATPEMASEMCLSLMKLEEGRLLELGVMEGEIRLTLINDSKREVGYRFLLWNETGFVHRLAAYEEGGNGGGIGGVGGIGVGDSSMDQQPSGSKEIVLKLLFEMDGDGVKKIIKESFKKLNEYPALSDIQIKRNRAHSMGTSWVYDYPSIFREGIEGLWRDSSNTSCDGELYKFQEIILNPSFIAKKIDSKESYKEWVGRILSLDDDDDVDNINDADDVEKLGNRISFSNREEGLNNIGMVAWKMWCRTPQRPNGYEFIVISNDIDTGIGAFGLEEDVLFAECSKLARRLGCPRIFISANSGARLGVCEEIRDHLKVHWRDGNEPDKGFDYLYLKDEIVKERSYDRDGSPVKLEKLSSGDWKITDVIGGLGIGVENLSGSGMIAGETSLAYKDGDIMTLTLVTGRSVGIGAYLVRLGQRVIQRESQPIILTGYQALNNLLGRELYSSNLQLGGPQIMSLNGVSHRIVTSDLVAIKESLKWMDYLRPVPIKSRVDDWLPFIGEEVVGEENVNDTSPFRIIDPSIIPKSDLEDPRIFLTGKKIFIEEEEHFLGGLLDRNSFQEYQEDWAKSVIVGRGRLCGEPLAVLMTESRQTHYHIPADPASPESSSSTKVTQAGGVWFPDSSKKTAQFISDCNWGERLPLLIIANWRGFSGGQMDLFGEILKFGSNIVDSIREYRQPITVYIPPNGQLRGGSWVVIDPTINPLWMQSFADPSSRGGIIEPEGLVGVKFREKQLLKLSHQTMSLEQRKKIEDGDKCSINTLMHRVACHFADLHDKPSRMLNVGSIDSIIPTDSIREFLSKNFKERLWHWRLLQRVLYLLSDLLIPNVSQKFLKYLLNNSFNSKAEAENLIQDFCCLERKIFLQNVRKE